MELLRTGCTGRLHQDKLKRRPLLQHAFAQRTLPGSGAAPMPSQTLPPGIRSRMVARINRCEISLVHRAEVRGVSREARTDNSEREENLSPKKILGEKVIAATIAASAFISTPFV